MRTSHLMEVVLLLAATSHASVSDQVDEVFTRYNESTPGCSVAASRDGKILFDRSFGLANLEHEVANSSETRFYAGSVSKQFTAAAVALLVLDGKLALDDDIWRYFPELPAYAEKISVRQLVHHTSGLRDYLTLMGLAGWDFANAVTTEEVIDLIARQQAPNFEPGTEYLYSNTGYFLLAELVARVTQSSLHEFAEKQIFEPFGMTHSHFHDDHLSLIPNRAEGYVSDEDGWKSNRTRFPPSTMGASVTVRIVLISSA